MARRARKAKTAAQIAASKRNLVKARAARQRASAGTKVSSARLGATGVSSADQAARQAFSSSIKKSGLARREFTVTNAELKIRRRNSANPLGARLKREATFSKASGGKIGDPDHFLDRFISRSHDKKGRSNANKLTAYLEANPGARLPKSAISGYASKRGYKRGRPTTTRRRRRR